jgi:hypothetical protein
MVKLGVILLVKLNGTYLHQRMPTGACALRHKVGEIDPNSTFNVRWLKWLLVSLDVL